MGRQLSAARCLSTLHEGSVGLGEALVYEVVGKGAQGREASSPRKSKGRKVSDTSPPLAVGWGGPVETLGTDPDSD